MNLVRTFFIAFFCFLFQVSSVHAQDYLHEHTAPVVHHVRKLSSHTFPKTGKIGNDISKSPIGILFTPKSVTSYAAIDEQAIRYDMPSRCTSGEVILEEVYHHTEGTEEMDIVAYEAGGSYQRNSSFKGAEIPWDPMYDIQAGHDSVDARFQDLIRSFNPKCLPARFRYVYSDNQRFQEIRYGNALWKK